MSRQLYLTEKKQARKTEAVINATINEFILSGYKSPYDINNGACEEFMQAVIDKLGGESSITFPLASDMFGDFGVLPKGFKSNYGNLPLKVKTYVNIPGHIWIYHKGRHFDAEKPEGVTNFLHLPVFEKAVKSAIYR